MAVQADISTEYSMGREGFALVTSTSLQTGNYSAIIPTQPTTFLSISGLNISGTWTGTTIPASFPLVGNITSFQIASGSVVAYLARA
jgi:hypothetical protein